MEKLKTYTQTQIESLVAKRNGETKLGERIKVLSQLDDLYATSAKFILLGIPEDVGVRANFGLGGAHTTWSPTLKAFLNVQSTTKLGGEEIGLLGYLDFANEMVSADRYDLNSAGGIAAIRDLVEMIDRVTKAVVYQIFRAHKVPMIVGGGHNNAYPILRALAEYHKKPVNVINVDAHADFRLLEGRHSGNGFSYAMEEAYLNKYAIVGLHENYNSQSMLHQLTSKPKQILCSFFEDYLRHQDSYMQAFDKAIHFTKGVCGFELDMDCMANTLSSAGSLTGFSVTQVREMISQTADKKLSYLHICEGVAKMNDGREDLLIGKLIATLITDFAKAQR